MSLLTASASSVADSFPAAPPLAHSYNSRGELGMFVNPWACSCVTCTEYVAARAPTPPPAPAALLAPPPADRCIWENRPFGKTATNEWCPCARCDSPFAARESVPFGPQATEPALSSTTLEDMYREMRAGAGTGAALGPAATGTDLGLSQVSYPPVPLGRTPANNLLDGSAATAAAPPAPSLTRSLTLGAPQPHLIFSRASLLAAIGSLPDTVEEEADGAAAPAAPGLRGVDAEEDDVMARLQQLRARLLIQQDHCHEGCRSHDEMAAADTEWDELDTKIHAIEALLSAFGVVFRTR